MDLPATTPTTPHLAWPSTPCNSRDPSPSLSPREWHRVRADEIRAAQNQLRHVAFPQPQAALHGAPAQCEEDDPDTIRHVAVLDWDNCLNDEYGAHYADLRRAVITVAEREAGTYPGLLRASRLLAHDIPDASNNPDTAPLLLLSRQTFLRHQSAHPELGKVGVIDDFLSRTLPGSEMPHKADILDAILAQRDTDKQQWLAQPIPSAADLASQMPATASLLPGAQAFLERWRKPENRLILISNCEQAQLDKEVAHLGVDAFFDIVSGTPTVTKPIVVPTIDIIPDEVTQRLMTALYGPSDEDLYTTLCDAAPFNHPDSTRVVQDNEKPDPTRLRKSLRRLSIPDTVPITAFGDKVGDIQQCAAEGRKGRAVTGVLISPTHPLLGSTVLIDGIPTRVLANLDGQ